jgi:hypothetical protein
MADALFDAGRAGFLGADIGWDSPTVIKISLVRGYTFNAAHDMVNDVTGAGGTLVSTATLGSTTITDGVADAADVVFTAVGVGAACTSLVIYQASALAGGADVASSAQRLIAYIDSASGLPVTPNGGNINVTWDNGANKIFKL